MFFVSKIQKEGLQDHTNLLRFVGFGDAGLEPAPPVGFNLTYQCPEGMVFDHNPEGIVFNPDDLCFIDT